METQRGGIVAFRRPHRITNARAALFASRGALFCRDMVTVRGAGRRNPHARGALASLHFRQCSAF